jgi:hypothetical protein
MTKRVANMTDEEAARVRARQAATRKSRAKPDAQVQVHLPEEERRELAELSYMELWSREALAAAYGVSRKVIANARRDYPRRTT